MRVLIFLLLPVFCFAQQTSQDQFVIDSLAAHQSRIATLESNPGGSGFDPATTVMVFDEFMGFSGSASGSSSAGALGEIGWSSASASSGGFNQGLNISVNNNPGVMRLNITGTAGSANKLYLKGVVRIVGDFWIKCGIRTSSVPSVNSHWGLVGLTDNIAGATFDTGANSGIAMGFGNTADSTSLVLSTTGTHTIREKGVAIATGVTDFYNMELFYDYSATTAYFYVNGVLVDTVSYTFQNADHSLFACGHKTATVGSSAVDFYIDYIYFEYTTTR